LVPLDLKNLIFVRGYSIALVLLHYHRLRFLLRNRIAVIVELLVLLSFFTFPVSFALFCLLLFLLLWGRQVVLPY
jgi:hypothetical protein